MRGGLDHQSTVLISEHGERRGDLLMKPANKIYAAITLALLSATPSAYAGGFASASVTGTGNLLAYFWAQSSDPDLKILDLSFSFGQKMMVDAPVTSWTSKQDTVNTVARIAGVSSSGDLLLFSGGAGGPANWQMVNLSAWAAPLTAGPDMLAVGGKSQPPAQPKIAGPVTSWQTTWQTNLGPDKLENIAAVSRSGDLLVFSWSSLTGWHFRNVSAATGQKMSGPITSGANLWVISSPPQKPNSGIIAGANPSGDLLGFYFHGNPTDSTITVANISAATGQKIWGPVAIWQDSYTGVHFASANSIANYGDVSDLAVFWYNGGWQFRNISAITGEKIRIGPLTAWTTGGDQFVAATSASIEFHLYVFESPAAYRGLAWMVNTIWGAPGAIWQGTSPRY
jgi:hypothetical protein